MKISWYILVRFAVVLALTAGTLWGFLAAELPWAWLFLALMAGIICAGTHVIILAHPGYRSLSTIPYWILPVSIALGGALVLRLMASGYLLFLGSIITLTLLAMALVYQYHQHHSRYSFRGLARFLANLWTYLAAFLIFVAIRRLVTDLIPYSLGVGLSSALLAVELFRENMPSFGDQPSGTRYGTYAVTIGIIMGELAWGLHYWPVGSVAGGISLLLAYYLVGGIVQSHLLGRLTRGVAMEFLGVALLGAVILYGSQRWMG